MHFNQLSPAEAERLAILAEECGEVVQIIGKILRHGYQSMHPEAESETNRDLLERELGDVGAAVMMMLTAGEISDDKIEQYTRAKSSRIASYLHHAE